MHIDDSDVLLHIGFHKTATTLLQSHLFVKQEYGFFRWADDRTDVQDLFVRRGPYDRVSRQGILELSKHVNQARHLGLTSVLSHERLSGYPPTGGYDSRLIADRLKQAFPNARVLIVIREQNSMIASVYGQFIQDGGALSLDDFLNPPEPRMRRVPGFDLNFYDYAKLINYYHELFSAAKVLVLPYEALKEGVDGFMNRIGRFARGEHWSEIASADTSALRKVNQRRPFMMQSVQRHFNATFYRNQLSLGAPLRLPKARTLLLRLEPGFAAIAPEVLERWLGSLIDAKVQRHVGDFYRESNLETNAITGIDLAKYRYKCSASATESAPGMLLTGNRSEVGP